MTPKKILAKELSHHWGDEFPEDGASALIQALRQAGYAIVPKEAYVPDRIIHHKDSDIGELVCKDASYVWGVPVAATVVLGVEIGTDKLSGIQIWDFESAKEGSKLSALAVTS